MLLNVLLLLLGVHLRLVLKYVFPLFAPNVVLAPVALAVGLVARYAGLKALAVLLEALALLAAAALRVP